jgi:hypothetical protein
MTLQTIQYLIFDWFKIKHYRFLQTVDALTYEAALYILLIEMFFPTVPNKQF